MKICIWGYFGYRNCGDDLLLQILLKNIKKNLNVNDEIIIFGNHDAIKSLLPKYKIQTVNRNSINFLKIALKADIMIIGPGGLFPHKNIKKLLAYYLVTKIMHIRGKRIGYIGIGMGIGMFQRNIDIHIINKIAQNSNCFCSRSENYNSFAPMLNTKNITLTADMVFSDSTLFYKKNSNERLVVIALANIFKEDNQKIKKEFINEILYLIKHILNKGYYVKLLPFTNEIDMELNHEIVSLISHPDCENLNFSENPYDTFKILSNTSFCIGMRFHSIVMSLINEIPVMSISYSDKNEDLMNRVGLSDYSFRFGVSKNEYFNEEKNIKHDELIQSFDIMTKEKTNIINKIHKNLPNIQRLSKINCDKLDMLFSQ